MSIIRKISTEKPELTQEQIARLTVLANQSQDDIDYSDIPEVMDLSDWVQAKESLFIDKTLTACQRHIFSEKA